jgi:hypothetical protein
MRVDQIADFCQLSVFAYYFDILLTNLLGAARSETVSGKY